MRVKGNCDLSLRVGPMREEDRISLIIEFEGDAPIVFWNGIRLSAPVKIVPIEQPEEETGKKECIIIKNTLKYDCAGMNTEGELTLTFNGEGILRYVEIRAE